MRRALLSLATEIQGPRSEFEGTAQGHKKCLLAPKMQCQPLELRCLCENFAKTACETGSKHFCCYCAVGPPECTPVQCDVCEQVLTSVAPLDALHQHVRPDNMLHVHPGAKIGPYKLCCACAAAARRPEAWSPAATPTAGTKTTCAVCGASENRAFSLSRSRVAVCSTCVATILGLCSVK